MKKNRVFWAFGISVILLMNIVSFSAHAGECKAGKTRIRVVIVSDNCALVVARTLAERCVDGKWKVVLSKDSKYPKFKGLWIEPMPKKCTYYVEVSQSEMAAQYRKRHWIGEDGNESKQEEWEDGSKVLTVKKGRSLPKKATECDSFILVKKKGKLNKHTFYHFEKDGWVKKGEWVEPSLTTEKIHPKEKD